MWAKQANTDLSVVRRSGLLFAAGDTFRSVFFSQMQKIIQICAHWRLSVLSEICKEECYRLYEKFIDMKRPWKGISSLFLFLAKNIPFHVLCAFSGESHLDYQQSQGKRSWLTSLLLRSCGRMVENEVGQGRTGKNSCLEPGRKLGAHSMSVLSTGGPSSRAVGEAGRWGTCSTLHVFNFCFRWVNKKRLWSKAPL